MDTLFYFVDKSNFGDMQATEIAERRAKAEGFKGCRRIGGWIDWVFEDDITMVRPEFEEVLREAKRQVSVKGKEVWVFLFYDKKEIHTGQSSTYVPEGKEVSHE